MSPKKPEQKPDETSKELDPISNLSGVARRNANLRRGGPGRPKGIPNRATAEIKAFAAGLVGDSKYIKSLQKRLREGKAPQMEVLLFHYGYGKPKEQLEHSGKLELSWLD